MKHLSKEILGLSAAFLAAVSCVDSTYDLSKPIDTTMNLVPGLSVPVGNLEANLADLLELSGEDGNSIVSVDANGNYFLEMEDRANHDKISVSLPSFTFETAGNNRSITIVSPSEVPYIPGQSTAELPYIALNQKVSFDFKVNQKSGIPEEVKSLEYAKVNGTAKISINYDSKKFPFKNIYINKGVTISFPEWVIISSVPEEFGLQNGKLVANREITVPEAGKIFNFAIEKIDFNKFPEAQGFIDGSLIVDDVVAIEGIEFKIKMSEIVNPPAVNTTYKPDITFKYEISKLDVNEIKGVFEPDIEITDFEYMMDELPEQLQGDKVKLDMAALQLDFEVDNGSPAAGEFNFNLVTSVGTEIKKQLEFKDLAINPEGTTKYSITEDGKTATEGFTPIGMAGLNSILVPIPDKFSISDMSCKLSQSPLTITLPETYEFDFRYRVHAPLSFGKDISLELPFIIPINAEGDTTDSGKSDEEVDFSIKTAVLKATVKSSIPLNFNLDCFVCDKDGNPVENDIRLDVLINGRESGEMIKGGTVEIPGESTIEIKLSNITMDFDIPALNLNFAASGSEELKGICLNEKQSLRLENISLSVPDGVTISNLKF